MEPIREVLHASLRELGLGIEDVEYIKRTHRKHLFMYPDQNGYLRYRKILLGPDDSFGTDEGNKTIKWFDFLGIGDYSVIIKPDYQIIDTPFVGHDLYYLNLGKSICDPYNQTYYPFNGFDRSEVTEWIQELEGRLLEFQRLTGLVHVDLFTTGRPNNIVWYPYNSQFPTFNVIDCEAFQQNDPRNLARFHGRWETAIDYIYTKLVKN